MIIGNGIAGTTAALNIRKQDAQAEITILSQEPYRFYSRIKLINFISGETPENKLFGFSPEWYEHNRINLHLNKNAQSLNLRLKQVRTLDGSIFSYDKLLVATGGAPRLPSVASTLNSSRIHTLRDLDHAKQIRSLASSISSVLILGGGILGIEIAGALQKTGKKVTILESNSRLLPRQMDAVGSQILRSTLENQGINFLLDAKANNISETADEVQIQLPNGQIVGAEMLIVSIGVNPCSELVRATRSDVDLTASKSIPVNDYLETEWPDLYAAGDVAEHQGISYGILAAAERQGKVAGTNMAGGKEKYQGTLASFVLKVSGVDLVCVGEIDVKNSLPSLIHQNEEGLYRKLIFKDGLLVGYILCGSTAGKKELLAALQKRESLATIEKILQQIDWPSHPPLATFANT